MARAQHLREVLHEFAEVLSDFNAFPPPDLEAFQPGPSRYQIRRKQL